jgi:anhydro-N-acetylmuramic acid kinase
MSAQTMRRVLGIVVAAALAWPAVAAAHPDEQGGTPWTAGPDDVVASVTALTARTIADACRRYDVTDVLASGGGTRNPVLMRMLREELRESTSLRHSDEAGLPAAAKEAYLFALLGFLTWHGVPATVPSCTGARHPSLLGSITPGAGPHVLPAPPPVPPTRLRIA